MRLSKGRAVLRKVRQVPEHPPEPVNISDKQALAFPCLNNYCNMLKCVETPSGLM